MRTFGDQNGDRPRVREGIGNAWWVAEDPGKVCSQVLSGTLHWTGFGVTLDESYRAVDSEMISLARCTGGCNNEDDSHSKHDPRPMMYAIVRGSK